MNVENRRQFLWHPSNWGLLLNLPVSYLPRTHAITRTFNPKQNGDFPTLKVGISWMYYQFHFPLKPYKTIYQL